MHPDHLLRQPVTILNPATTEDGFGNEVKDWANADEANEYGYLEHTESTEVLVDRETYTSDWLVVLDAASVVRADSRVVYDDLTLEVVGPPQRTFNPRVGATSHVEVRAAAVTG